MKKRELWVDIYKGILIVLMVLGHTLSGLTYWIYPFHMSAFFFISGYLTDYDKEDFIDFFKKKAKALLIPLVLSTFLFIGLLYFLRIVGVAGYYYDVLPGKDLILNFLKYLWAPDLGGAFWFLIVLFLSEIAGKIFHDLLKRQDYKSKDLVLREWVLSLILTMFSYFLFIRNRETLPYYLHLIPLAYFFLSSGQLLKKKVLKLDKIAKTFLVLCSLFFYIWYQFHYFHFEWVGNFPNIIIVFFSSFSGIILLMCIVKGLLYFGKKINYQFPILQYLGKNTLAIMIYHFLGFRVLFTILYGLGILKVGSLKWLTPKYQGFIPSFLTSIFAILFSIAIYHLATFVIRKIIKSKFWKRDFFKNKYVNIFLLACLVFFVSRWVYSLYFSFDDWNNLFILPPMKLSDMFIILPDSVYCSRPGGWIIVKIFLNLFGYNYKAHATMMLLIHIFNAICVYKISTTFFQKCKFKNSMSFVTSLIFALYPISNFASFWEAGMFDLFGTTLMLLTIIIFLKITTLKPQKDAFKKGILSLLMMITYYCSLRTKEMFIALPVAFVFYSFMKHLENHQATLWKVKEWKIKEYLKNNWYLIILVLIMFAYFALSRVLNASSTVTNNIHDPYYYSFNPIGLIKNLFAYIYIYFSNQSMVYGDVLNIIKYSDYYKIGVFFGILGALYMSIYKLIKKDYTPFILLVFFGVTILPILPMPNMHHILYLYAPQIFIAMFLVYIVYNVLKPYLKTGVLITLSTIILLLFLNRTSSVLNFREFWTNTAKQDQESYEYFVELSKKYHGLTDIYIQNVPEDHYTSLYQGKGYIVQVAFNDRDLKIHINRPYQKRKHTLEIDFNDYDYQILQEG